ERSPPRWTRSRYPGEVLLSPPFGPPHGKGAQPPVESRPMPSVWRSNLYLLASFPVGLATFVFFVTMISVGASLLIVWVGVPILIATVASTKFLAAGERRRAGWLLREPIPSLYLPSHRR